MPIGTNGGQVGPSAGSRKRNTFANLLSKTNFAPGGSNLFGSSGGGTGGAQSEGALPALSPESTANYYAQLSALQAQYSQTIADLRRQRVGIRAGFQESRAGLKAQTMTGVRDVQQSAVERGVLGGSGELAQRAEVRGAGTAAIAAERRGMLEGLADTRSAQQRAALGLFQGQTALESQALAERQNLLAQQLQQNLIVSGQEAQMNAMKQIYGGLTSGLAGIGAQLQAGYAGVEDLYKQLATSYSYSGAVPSAGGSAGGFSGGYIIGPDGKMKKVHGTPRPSAGYIVKL